MGLTPAGIAMVVLFFIICIVVVATLYKVYGIGTAVGATIGAGLFGGWCYFSMIADNNIAYMAIVFVPALTVIGGTIGALIGFGASQTRSG